MKQILLVVYVMTFLIGCDGNHDVNNIKKEQSTLQKIIPSIYEKQDETLLYAGTAFINKIKGRAQINVGNLTRIAELSQDFGSFGSGIEVGKLVLYNETNGKFVCKDGTCEYSIFIDKDKVIIEGNDWGATLYRINYSSTEGDNSEHNNMQKNNDFKYQARADSTRASTSNSNSNDSYDVTQSESNSPENTNVTDITEENITTEKKIDETKDTDLPKQIINQPLEKQHNYNQEAKKYFDGGDLLNAEKFINESIVENPRNMYSYFLKAQIHMKKGEKYVAKRNAEICAELAKQQNNDEYYRMATNFIKKIK